MNLASIVGPTAWANVRGHRLQAALIALTLAACATLLTVGLAARSASGNAFDRLWRDTNGADLWLYLDARKVTVAQVHTAMVDAPGVAEWSGPTPQVRLVPVGVTEHGFGSGFTVRDWPTDASTIGRPLITAGRAPRAGEQDVVVLDRNFAEVTHVRVGDTFAVPTPRGGAASLRVIGLQASAEQCPYPLCSPQTIYLTPHGLAALGLAPSRSSGQYAVAIRATREASGHLDRLRDTITARLPAGAVAFSATATATRLLAQFGYAAQSGLLLVFALAAAATAALLIVVAIGAAVRSDIRRTGLLKAVGFSAAQLRLTAVAEYGGLAAIGSTVGGVAGALVAPRILDPVSAQFGSASPGSPWVTAALAVVGVAAFTCVVALAAVRRPLRVAPVVALRADRQGNTAATALLSGPVVLARAVGDVIAGRGRSVLIAATITLAAGGLVVSALFAASMDQFLHTGLAFDGARSGDLVAIGPDRPGDLATIRAQPGVAAVVRERNTSFSLAGSTETLNLRLRDGSGLPQPLVAGRPALVAGELVAGYGLAHTHHLHLGQPLGVVVSGTVRAFHIVGINREVDNLGQMATILPQSLPDLTNITTPPQYLIRLKDGARAGTVVREISAATGGLVNPAVVGVGNLPPLIGSIIPVTRSLAAVLALLTVLGVFNAVLLAIQERRREYGLVRTVGMNQAQVMASTLTGVVVLAAVACLVGVPLAILVGRLGIGAVMGQVGVGYLAPPVSTAVFAVAPLVLLIAVIGAAGPAWSASRTPVIDALRAE